MNFSSSGENIGLKFIPSESEAFWAIPKSIFEPIQTFYNPTNPNQVFNPNQSELDLIETEFLIRMNSIQSVFRIGSEWLGMIRNTRSVRKVWCLPLYLRAGVILHHRAGGILQSNPHLIE